MADAPQTNRVEGDNSAATWAGTAAGRNYAHKVLKSALVGATEGLVRGVEVSNVPIPDTPRPGTHREQCCSPVVDLMLPLQYDLGQRWRARTEWACGRGRQGEATVRIFTSFFALPWAPGSPADPLQNPSSPPSTPSPRASARYTYRLLPRF